MGKKSEVCEWDYEKKKKRINQKKIFKKECLRDREKDIERVIEREWN